MAPTLPPTAASLPVTPPTQLAPAVAPYVAPTQHAPPPVMVVTQHAPPPPGAWSPRATSATEDRSAIAGRAAVAAALSSLAVVGCCNPLGWIGIVVSLRAYANTDQADLGPAAERARSALRLGWMAFGSTAALWVLSIAAWWFNP